MKKALKFYLLMMFLLSNSIVKAQMSGDDLPVGPYTYTPDEGTNRWTDPSPAAKHVYKEVCMDQLPMLHYKENGLMVAFDLDLNLEENGKPLIAFACDMVNFIEIFYSNRTATIKRYNTVNGERVHYEYHLFDPLFQDVPGNVTWRFKVYFTADFMYIVCGVKNSDYKYMSPLYFGLDGKFKQQTVRSMMTRFRGGDDSAVLKFGNPNWTYLPYISNIIINSFVYWDSDADSDWWRKMQSEFSSPNPPHM